MAPQSSTYANGEVLTDPLRQTFVEIMKSQGIAEEVGEIIMVEPQELKGEHMATLSVYVKVEFKGGVRKPKNLFVKKHVNNAGHQEVTKKMRIMQKEGKFLFEFLPKMREFCGKFPGYAVCNRNCNLHKTTLYKWPFNQLGARHCWIVSPNVCTMTGKWSCSKTSFWTILGSCWTRRKNRIWILQSRFHVQFQF